MTRSTRWGNPHRIGVCRGCGVVHDRAGAVAAFARDLTPERVAEIRRGLAGATVLACFCPVDQPCHADVLIQILLSGPVAS